jgi:hypothetical protein
LGYVLSRDQAQGKFFNYADLGFGPDYADLVTDQADGDKVFLGIVGGTEEEQLSCKSKAGKGMLKANPAFHSLRRSKAVSYLQGVL